MLPNVQMMLIMGALALAIVSGAYMKGRYDGSAACGARHAEAQLKAVEKMRKNDVKIKRAAPGDGDKLAAIKFLREHVRP